jgi:hypothetical protein
MLCMLKDSVQRTRLFKTTCKTKDKVCKMIIESGSTDNLVSTEMVKKLELETTAHPSLYKVSWLQKGHQVMVIQQCKVEFKIGGYKDEILCDVIPMDVCHDGRKNTYTLEKNGRTQHKNTSHELEGTLKGDQERSRNAICCSEEARGILTNTFMNDLPEEIQELLENFVDIVVDELPHLLPPIRSIDHHIDLILGASL